MLHSSCGDDRHDSTVPTAILHRVGEHFVQLVHAFHSPFHLSHAHLNQKRHVDFEATPNSLDDNPQCRETWHFAEDGTGWVQSAEQRITNRWRVLIYRARYPAIVVYRIPLTSNAGPDCLGDPVMPESYPREERGFIITFADDGSARICGAAEFQHSFDGTRRAPLIGGREDCWGILRPAGASG